jgi:hypothetical protein
MIPYERQIPRRTFKEATQDNLMNVRSPQGCVDTLAGREIPALARLVLPDDKDRQKLLKACAKEPLTDVMLDDLPHHLGYDDTVVGALCAILLTAVGLAKDLERMRLIMEETFSSDDRA